MLHAFPRALPSSLHTSTISRAIAGSEEFPAESEVVGALESDPEGLGARRVLGVDVTAELSDESHHDAQRRRVSGGILATDDFPDRFPLARFEDRVAIDVGLAAS